mmetsp:Transcript_104536/g.292905  ORF Transcript_104536/g.292905 Transcript_104536/m.292905 type:complete len:207 (-) Transcript_104536:254-874(-)
MLRGPLVPLLRELLAWPDLRAAPASSAGAHRGAAAVPRRRRRVESRPRLRRAAGQSFEGRDAGAVRPGAVGGVRGGLARVVLLELARLPTATRRLGCAKVLRAPVAHEGAALGGRECGQVEPCRPLWRNAPPSPGGAGRRPRPRPRRLRGSAFAQRRVLGDFVERAWRLLAHFAARAAEEAASVGTATRAPRSWTVFREASSCCAA